MGEKRSYRPSNGTEGIAFMEQFCFECEHDRKYQETQDGEDGCKILAASMIYDFGSPRYPKEWIADDEDGGCCTAYERYKTDGRLNVPESMLVPVEWLSPKERQGRLRIV